ncbi:restriction endonuclease subunit S [Helicobacter pylori]|uniref:Type I R-M system S protein n=1 Tax=Helicobacter pylori (strain India7) TaxID=907238 RepID=E8QFL8_HELP7|nr:restriction endonuclease subunit S [Helicobacter pylori]ADU79780.1 type I R-M system S protein [Helicobacter pylori India7]
MHKIERLLQTLAPKGVEFRKIGEICLIKRGRVIAKKILQENGKYPVYSSQTLNNGILGFIDTYDFDGEFLTWTTDGAYAGSVFYRKGRFSITNVCGLLQVIQDNILHKYLYYILQITTPLHVSSGMGNPKLMSAAMQQITIPIPPLEIQQEIVKILDAFTELNTELNARKKQYQYYQNMLLDFDGIHSNHKDAKEKLAQKTYPKRLKTLLQTLAPKGVEFRKLGEVINIFKGKQLNKELLLDYGEYPVMNGGIHASGYWNEYNTDYPKIIISQGGASAGYVNYMTSKFWAGAHCYTIELNSEKLNYKFLYYFLKNSQIILMKSQFGAGIPALNKADIETLTIPIPPLEIQQEIVKILDQFSILTTDLLAGIPAEIKARKKQYEYYREKLLTFKPLTQNKEVKKC